MTTLFKGGTAVTPDGVHPRDVLVEGGQIAAVRAGLEPEHYPGCRLIDCRGKLLLPGLIDAHVHFSPSTADDFTSGTMAAAFGGVTTVIGYAGPRPGEELLQGLERKMTEAAGRAYVDYTFHVEILGWHNTDLGQLRQIRQAGISSLKVYTTYGEDQLPDDRLLTLLRRAEKEALLVTVHAEQDKICAGAARRLAQARAFSVRTFSDSRPPEAEAEMVEKLAVMALRADAPVYVVHVSTARAARAIARGRAQQIRIYGETCPQYLLLTDACYQGDDGTLYLVTPPLRKHDDQIALWQAIRQGTLSCITTDHCAYPAPEKRQAAPPFQQYQGLPGVQTSLPLMYTHGVMRHRLTLEELVRLMSENPARMFGLYPRKGTLLPGSDADIAVIDPERRQMLHGTQLQSRCGYTPYEGWEVCGVPIHVMCRGALLVYQGKWTCSEPGGQFIRAGRWTEPGRGEVHDLF